MATVSEAQEVRARIGVCQKCRSDEIGVSILRDVAQQRSEYKAYCAACGFRAVASSQAQLVLGWRANQGDVAMREAAARAQALPPVEAGARDERTAFDVVRAELVEFSQRDDYLLANGASLMSEDSHEIIHVDTVRRIIRAALARASEAAAEDDDTRERIARALHYPACWDTAAYPTLDSAVWESIACAKIGCSECESASEAAAAIAQTDGARFYKHIDAEGNPYWLHTPPQAQAAGEPVPTGWKLVPVEPTVEMKIAGDNAGFWCGDKWRAMLAAAPQPASEQQAERGLSDEEILRVFSKFTIYFGTSWQKVQVARALFSAAKGDGHAD